MKNYLKRFWGVVPVILFLIGASCVRVVKAVSEVALTDTFRIVMLWLGIASMGTLLLWAGFRLNIMAHSRGRAGAFLYAAGQTVTTGLFLGLILIGVCASILIRTPTVCQPPHNMEEDASAYNSAPGSESVEVENADTFEIKKLDIAVTANRENELVFAVSADDFIDSYNGYFWANYNSRGLAPLREWNYMQCSHSLHSPHTTDRYWFSYNYQSWALPKITVDTPPDKDYILGIYLNLDDHSRTDATYEQYKNMCFLTLKVFFPDFSDEKIDAVFQKLTRLAYNNRYDSNTTFDDSIDIVPCALYHQDGIGLYPYFLHGNCRLCVIPVDEEAVNSFAEKGTDIYNIDEEFQY